MIINVTLNFTIKDQNRCISSMNGLMKKIMYKWKIVIKHLPLYNSFSENTLCKLVSQNHNINTDVMIFDDPTGH